MISGDILVHIGAFLMLLAYLVRDQILLRGLIILGTIFYIVSYFFMDPPLWSALLWSASFVVINAKLELQSKALQRGGSIKK